MSNKEVGEGANYPPDGSYDWYQARNAKNRMAYDALLLMSDLKVKRAYENKMISRKEFLSGDWIQDSCEYDDPWIVNRKTGKRRGGPMPLPSTKHRK